MSQPPPTTSIPKLAGRPLPTPTPKQPIGITGTSTNPQPIQSGTPTNGNGFTNTPVSSSPSQYPPNVLKSPPPLKPRAKSNLPPVINSLNGGTTSTPTTTNTSPPTSPPPTPANQTSPPQSQTHKPPPSLPKRDYTGAPNSIGNALNNSTNSLPTSTPTPTTTPTTTQPVVEQPTTQTSSTTTTNNTSSPNQSPLITQPVSTPPTPQSPLNTPPQTSPIITNQQSTGNLIQSIPPVQIGSNSTTTTTATTPPSTTPPTPIPTASVKIPTNTSNNNGSVYSSSAPNMGKSNSFSQLPKPDPLQVPNLSNKSTDDHPEKATSGHQWSKSESTPVTHKSDKEIKKEEKEKEKREKEERKEKEKLEKKEKKEREKLEKEKLEKEKRDKEAKKDERGLSRGSSSFANKLKHATLSRNTKVDDDDQPTATTNQANTSTNNLLGQNRSISVSNITPTTSTNSSPQISGSGSGSSLSVGGSTLNSSGSIAIINSKDSTRDSIGSGLSISPTNSAGGDSPLLGANSNNNNNNNGGGRSAIHLDTQRGIMTWGSSSNSKLGFKTTNKDQSQSQPERLPNFNIQDIVSISCGSYYSAALTEDGEVYMWGRGAVKSTNIPTLGNDQTEDQTVPIKVESLSDIILISIGFYHSAAVKSNGELLTWGCGEDGQLGHGTFDNSPFPKVIESLTSHWITQVSCGEKHTICLTKNGKVYAWGTSEYGQLGLGDTNKHCSPMPVTALEKYNVIQIASGSTHCAVLTTSKEVLVFGNGSAIGNASIVSIPVLVPSLRYLHVEKISCGHYSTAALTECGDVYTWGTGPELGHGTQTESLPKLVETLRNQSIRQISCGGRHTAFLTDSGRIFTCGKDSFGQLGHSSGDQNKPKKIESLLKTTFLSISCGENHNAVIFDTTRSYRDKFCWKLLETQRTFVRTLDLISSIFLNPLRVRDRDQLPENQRHLPYIFLSDEEIRTIFGQIEKLYAVNSTLLHVMNKRFSNWSNKKKIGDVLLNHFKLTDDLFSQYIANLPHALVCLDGLTKKQTSPVNNYLKECEKLALDKKKLETDDDSKDFTLRSLLIEPLYVMSRYHKNINGMVKYTKTTHIDYAGLVDLDSIMEEKVNNKVQNIINIIQNPTALAQYTTSTATSSDDSSSFLKEYDQKIESLQNFRKTCAKIIKSSKKYYEVEPESFKEQGHFSENLSLAKTSFDGFIDPTLVSSLEHFSSSIKKIGYLRSELSTRTNSAFSQPLSTVSDELEAYIPLIIEMRKRVLEAHTEYDAAIHKLYSLAKNLQPTDKKMLDAEKEVASLKKNLDRTLYEFEQIFKDGVAIQTKSLKLFYACMKAQQEYFERGLQRFFAMKSSFDALDNYFRQESREKWSKFIFDALIGVFADGKIPSTTSTPISTPQTQVEKSNTTPPPLDLGSNKDDESTPKSTLLEPHVIMAELEKEDWNFILDPPSTNEFTDTFIEDQYNQLVEILATPSLQVVQCVISPCQADEQARTIESISRIFETFGRIRPIIQTGIELEVQSTANPSTLFRSNTIATKLMTSFTKLKGMAYLQKYIIPLVNEIIENPNGYEVDPSKINEGSEELMTNMMNLIQVSERFTDAIIESLNGLPMPLREISRHIQSQVVSKFPDNKHSSVGGFIFLRFLCPAIISPFNNGLVDEAPGTEANRALILIGKVLQNLANGIEFGQKESFMIPVNRFITGNLQRLYAYFDRLTDVPDNKTGDYVITSKEEVQKDIRNIHSLIVKNYPKVVKQLAIHRQKDIIGSLSKTLVYLGDPSAMYK
ncbi:regulator of chromosome condensation domain-containing protein [Tieghemostelium lacteum]|uniref:Regulator of chromosome condensation domain-containing protein n=1 Tax=Tieghemostelium lacteum TaxID=361077 RepID=A0A152A7P7_TIELA|nr:regulator of chromosome condensation domain-containing protein [Tieghemostelium lacteum]|eukprot:KYR02236.1 regulator of chromosome condensation domain-containing protein [Tieghemostelium lacteum]